MTEKYLWLGRTRLLAIFDNNDTILQRFLYADGRMPLAMEQAGELFYFAYDQVGSLRAVTDASGHVIKNVLYDAFGRVISDSNPELKVPFGLAGGLQDQDTGLVRFGYRDYDPDLGRWTAKDPIGFDIVDTNVFQYCSGYPVYSIDPIGLRGKNPGPSKFVKNYIDMRSANTIGADKYFHCKANCEAAQAGDPENAKAISDLREWMDEHVKGDDPSACAADREANDYGRDRGIYEPYISCKKHCEKFRPAGLSNEY